MGIPTIKKPHYPRVNFDEFCSLVTEEQKADLIDGVIYMASPENIEHNEISNWLGDLLRGFLRKKKLGGKVLSSRVAFRLDEMNSPEPDLGYVRPERAHLAKGGFVDGGPDLAVEIVSPDSVDRDYIKKRQKFAVAGIPEYWIIDPLEQKMMGLRLDKQGEYQKVKAKKDRLLSEVIPGFWVRPAWFWQDPLPDLDLVLEEILATTKNK